MSIYKGTTLLSGVATNTITNAHDLFDWKWTDHELNDQSWLKADTFSWQDGTVYSDAYSHLVTDYSGGTSQTETIGSYTITFVEATDGHRITTDESTVDDIYTESGVAWFYVLDTTNQRFKLPRSTHGQIVERLTSGSQWAYVYADGWCEQGGYIEGETNAATTVYLLRSMPDDQYVLTMGNTNNTQARSTGTPSYRGIFQHTGTIESKSTDSFVLGNGQKITWRICGYLSSVPNNTPYQKLYFYVGQFSQSATEQTAGLNASLFNGKVDLDGNNATFAHIVETYNNGTDWYIIYSNGKIRQGGRSTVSLQHGTTNVSLLKAYSSTNYSVNLSMGGYPGEGVGTISWNTLSTDSFNVYGDYNSSYTTIPFCWETFG